VKYYSIGDVCRIIDVKPHVLRYWEQEIPTLLPKKNHFGTRMYTRRDIQACLRVKHLLYNRKYTIDGARNRMLEEMSGGAADYEARIEAMKDVLIKMMGVLADMRERMDTLASPGNDKQQT